MSHDKEPITSVINEETTSNCTSVDIEKRHDSSSSVLKNVSQTEIKRSPETEGTISRGSESQSTQDQPRSKMFSSKRIGENPQDVLSSHRAIIQRSPIEKLKEKSTTKDSLRSHSLQKEPQAQNPAAMEPSIVKLCAHQIHDKSNNKNEKLKSPKYFGERFTKASMKKCVERRRRIDNRKLGADSFSWISNPPEAGYIQHPDAKLLIHPSFFSEEGFELCRYNDRCIHERNCGETRIRMAAMSYLRHKDCTTYRDLELIWGVSRSTIQRKTNEIQTKKLSDLIFLLNP